MHVCRRWCGNSFAITFDGASVVVWSICARLLFLLLLCPLIYQWPCLLLDTILRLLPHWLVISSLIHLHIIIFVSKMETKLLCASGSDDDSMVSHHSQCWGIKCGISGGGASWLFAKNKYIAGVESGWGVEYDAHHIDHNVKGLKIFTLLFLLIPSCYKQHWEPCTCHSWWCEWEQKIHNMRCWFTGKYFLVAEVL